MKRIKRTILLCLTSLLLVACSNKDNSNEQTDITISNEEHFIFTSGVDKLGDSYASSDNFVGIEGISDKGNTIYVVIDGIVVDFIIPDNQGVFKYYTKSKDISSRFFFSDDTDITVGDKKITENDLDYSKAVNVYPNEGYLALLSKERKQIPDNVFSLNEEAIIFDYKGRDLYSLKITNVQASLSQTDETHNNSKPRNTIEISYEYKNYSYESPIEVSSEFLTVYNQNNSAGKKVSINNEQTKVSNGKSATTTTWFTMPESLQDSDAIKIVYEDDFSLGLYGSITFDISLN